jgi:hypothetical protein
MIAMCRQAGYKGYWGIESGYNREAKSNYWENETKGVALTKAVLERNLKA